nr:primosomal protein N' [Lachnospiraceae bacterium]
YQPGHYAIKAAAQADYEGFFRQEMAFRRALSYPPVSHVLVALILSAKEPRADGAAVLLSGAAGEFVRENGLSTTVVGPAPASLAKANDLYRRMVYFKETDYSWLVALKNFLEGYILYSEHFKNVNVQFDFDPISGY